MPNGIAGFQHTNSHDTVLNGHPRNVRCFFCLGVRHMLYSDSYVLELATVWVARAKIAKHAQLAGCSLCARVFLNHLKKSILN